MELYEYFEMLFDLRSKLSYTIDFGTMVHYMSLYVSRIFSN